MGNYRESGEVLFMKNGMKKTAAVVMAAMLMGTGAVVPAAEDMGIFSQTAIVAEAASVGKVTGLKSKTLSNSEIQLKWSERLHCLYAKKRQVQQAWGLQGYELHS